MSFLSEPMSTPLPFLVHVPTPNDWSIWQTTLHYHFWGQVEWLCANGYVSSRHSSIQLMRGVPVLGGPRDQLPPPSFFTWRRFPGRGAPPLLKAA
jgi:hypothetical protein